MIKQFLIKFWKDDRGIAPLVGLGLKFGVPALAGLIGGGGNKQQQEQETEEEFQRRQSGQNLVNFGQQGGQLVDPLIQSQLQQLQRPIEFDQEAIRNLGFRQAQGIDRSFEGAERARKAAFAAQGLNFSPGPQSVSIANLLGTRAGALGQNQANIEQQLFNLPQLRQQMELERIRSIQNSLGLFRGSEFTSQSSGQTNRTSTGRSSVTDPGGGRHAFQGLANALALNAGNGPEQFNLPSLQGINQGNPPLDASIQAPNFNQPFQTNGLPDFLNQQQNPLS